ncbi:MAG: hypothetical protein GX601_00080 [Anaerolineales bacterium]|nr:hypothetical protein [Anaerolineales bacterium]
MSHTILVHLISEEPILAEIDEIPTATDQVLICSNVRRRDGHEISYISPEATTVIFPWSRIQCVEVMVGESSEQIVSFIRE